MRHWEAAFTTGMEGGAADGGSQWHEASVGRTSRRFKQHNGAMWLDVASFRFPCSAVNLSTRALKGQVRIVPVSGNNYRMELTCRRGASLGCRNGKGRLFVFDAAKLVEYRPPAANVRAPVNTDTPTDIPEVLNGP